jgi:hypothetical protein
MVKKLPVKMLQQCCSASTCMQTHTAMLECYTGCQHSKSFLLNCPPCSFFVLQYKTWLNSQAADFFDIGTQQLISQCNNASIPAMTTLKSSLSMCILFLVYDKLSSHCSFCYQLNEGNFPNSTHTLLVNQPTGSQ